MRSHLTWNVAALGIVAASCMNGEREEQTTSFVCTSSTSELCTDTSTDAYAGTSSTPDRGAGTTPAAGCNAQTCPTGCCEGPVCRLGHAATACGGAGAACTDCQGRPDNKRTCHNQQCVACSPTSCAAGCCKDGACNNAPNGRACGLSGAACVDCVVTGSNGRNCVQGNCRPCTTTYCPNGCCDTDGNCRGRDNTHCGTSTITCVNCEAMGKTCGSSLTCADCDPTTCSGCCSGGKCIVPTDFACGKQGAACVDCTATGEVCSSLLECAPCNAQTCDGCCKDNRCFPGTWQLICGHGGAACQECVGETKVCGFARACSACNATSCPDGCCREGLCYAPPYDYGCGTGGVACENCTLTSKSCTPWGECVPCNGTTCPNGCCVGGLCISQSTIDTPPVGLCGRGGAACASCATQQKTCDESTGQCVDCNATTCPNGCCRNGECVLPSHAFWNVNDLCGKNGAACTSCAMLGKTCNVANGACVDCNVTSCPEGCCDNGVCRPGNSVGVCGSRGEACLNCYATGRVCDNHRCRAW